MIHDVDESLRRLTKREALAAFDADVTFDAPTRDWATRRTGPLIDLYLYDIREDLERRRMAQVERRDDDGRVRERVRPPRMFRLSYLVSAWTQRPEDEHRLLSDVLGCFLRHETMPANDLAGSLVGAPASVLLFVAQPQPDRSSPDLWSALGGELKPALDLVVVAPYVATGSTPAGPPVLETPRVRVTAEEPHVRRTSRRRVSRAGTAPDAGPPPGERVTGGDASQPGRILEARIKGRS